VKVSVVCPGYVGTNFYQAQTVVNVPREQVREQVAQALKLVDASPAARTILRGVSRNQAVIIFPASIRLFWYLYRLFPRLTDRILFSQIRTMRKYRLNP
jgi:short-subunit dehydrogenase